jgi:tRNA-dihydrouridine synthase A
MMDWTDRHCRYFHRLLSKHTRLYTEMVTTGALMHGDVKRHLQFNAEEHPLALQLGGSEPADLAHCARLAEQWGYDEVNLNCGCPSERVQRGSFGACLMAEPALVADGVKAMRDAVSIPVTVKHRIGIDRIDRYDFVRDFVGTLADAGCDVFIVHARNAWLKGLSPAASAGASEDADTPMPGRGLTPKENREIPPLRYETVYRLKRDFPALTIVLNGGVTTDAQITTHLENVDGVMVGRQAYHDPFWLAGWDAAHFGERLDGQAFASSEGATPAPSGMTARPHQVARTAPDRASIEAAMVEYMERLVAEGEPWMRASRHMLGLWNSTPGARHWRQVWSDHRRKADTPSTVSRAAHRGVASALID